MQLSTPVKRILKISLVIIITITVCVYYTSYRNILPLNPINCTTHIKDTNYFFKKDNITYDCKPLEKEDCQTTYDDYYKKTDPYSVLERSSVCDLEWPQFRSVSQEELNFPLAYFITAFTDARNLELMLATIFRPHNSYCVHIDTKSDPIFSRSVRQMLHCYRARYPGSYAFSSSRSVPVFWTHFSIVEAELLCLRDILENDRPWSYALDMAGSELMLYTNKELVANLSSTNKPEIYTESFPIPEGNMHRIKHKHKYKEGAEFDPDHATNNLIKLKEAPDPIPFGLAIYKGAKSYCLPRHFVYFLLTHPVASSFIEWSKTTAVPDEMVVPTLARISAMKMTNGSWEVEQDYVPQPWSHFQMWYKGCRGMYRNKVCVLTLKDLSTIVKDGWTVVNKVRSDFEPYLAECFRDAISKREKLQ